MDTARVTDTRFTTVCDGLDGLLDAVDLYESDDIETLLIALFGRPVEVREGWNDESAAVALDVRIHGDDFALGSLPRFPLSIVELARSCGEDLEGLCPFTQGEDIPEGARDSETMSEDEIISALAKDLGFVRMFDMLDDD